jgi:hypothetical protein
MPGDGSLSTRVLSQTATSAWAKAGPMLRLSADPGAPYYAVLATPGNGVVVQWRKTQGAGTNQLQLLGSTVPVFLSVTRVGTTFTAATSTDGVNWTTIAGSSVAVPALTGALQRGFAVTSHNSTKISTVVFDTVTTAG